MARRKKQESANDETAIFSGLDGSRGDRPEEILKAVLKRVVLDGADGLTIRGVANEAGVSTGLILHYYSTKEELLKQAWLYAISISRFGERLSSLVGPVKGLDYMDAVYRVCFTDRDPETPSWAFWLEYWAKAARTPHLREVHSQIVDAARENDAEHAREAIATGQIRADLDPQLVGEVYRALIYGLAVGVTLDWESLTNERAIEISRFFLSLLKP
jgi:TetR/AcrR family transcriptional regulator, transcriptional repressor of bet genes